MSNKQIEPVDINVGVLVTMPFERFQSFQNLEEDKIRMAKHVEDHNKNYAILENKYEQLQKDHQVTTDLYEALQEEVATLKAPKAEETPTKKKAAPKKPK